MRTEGKRRFFGWRTSEDVVTVDRNRKTQILGLKVGKNEIFLVLFPLQFYIS